jgi:hypothetical protein
MDPSAMLGLLDRALVAALGIDVARLNEAGER